MGKTVFTEGNPGQAIPATVVHDAWLNAMQNHVHDGADQDGHCPLVIGQFNSIIDGCCRVGQSPILTLVNNVWGYGKVDLIAGMASGTAVSAGTLTQATAAPVGRTGYAAQFAGVTITGAGVIYSRYRAESLNSLRYKNQQASFSCLVYHDTGVSINYTITVRKATVADNFTATTVIATGVAQSVPTATGTLLKMENIAMGDCSNGIEIEVRADCGAITAKNFYITELGLNEGAVAQLYSWRPIGQELALVQRHFELSTSQEGFSGYVVAGSGYLAHFTFKSNKRSAPTMVFGDTGLNSSFPAGAPTLGGVGTTCGYCSKTANATANSGYYYYYWTADCRL